MRWLIRLYPRAWRRRYGAEVEELVAMQPSSLGLAVDLLAGAVDAHWKPQVFAPVESGASTENEGLNMLNRLKSCRSASTLSPKDVWLSGALTILGSLVVAAIVMVWDDPIVETMALVMLPGVWLLATQPFYMRGRSTASKVVLIGGPLLVLALIGVVTVFIQQRIL